MKDIFGNENNKRVSVSFILMLALVVAGCEKQEGSLAMINGLPVSQEQFDAYLELKRLTTNDEKRRDALLNQYLEREALAKVIEESEILNKPLLMAEVNEFRKEKLISQYFEIYLQDQVSDEAAKNYYASNPEKYQVNKVHVAHILHRTNRNMSETERKAKLSNSQAAYSQLKAGRDFAVVAKEYSEDAVSAKKGGDLGWLKQGAIDKRFSEIVFKMNAGEISEPFETPFGFHIVKLIEGPTVEIKPFEAVKGDIRYQLRSQAKEAELKRLLSQAEIERK